MYRPDYYCKPIPVDYRRVENVSKGVSLLHDRKLPPATAMYFGMRQIIYPSINGFCYQPIDDRQLSQFAEYSSDIISDSHPNLLGHPSIVANPRKRGIIYVLSADRSRVSVAQIREEDDKVQGELKHRDLIEEIGGLNETKTNLDLTLPLEAIGKFGLVYSDPPSPATNRVLTYDPMTDDLEVLAELPSTHGKPVCCSNGSRLYWYSEKKNQENGELWVIDLLTGKTEAKVSTRPRVCAMAAKPDKGIVMLTDGFKTTRSSILEFVDTKSGVENIGNLRAVDQDRSSICITGRLCYMFDENNLFIGPEYQRAIPMVLINLQQPNYGYRTELQPGNGEVATTGRVVQFTSPHDESLANPRATVGLMTNIGWAYQLDLAKFTSKI